MRQEKDNSRKRFRADGKADKLRLQGAGARRRKASPLQRLLLILAAAAALGAAALLVNYLIHSRQLRREQAELSAAYHQPAASPLPSPEEPPQPLVVFNTKSPQSDAPQPQPTIYERQAASDRFLPLMRRNNDIVGWLKYPAFHEMDFAVVHRDNTHYLRRSFTGENNLAGTVFMEQSNSIRPRDTNLILHGHNMADGTMFGKLARYWTRPSCETSPFSSLTPSTRIRPMSPTR